jgi:hypothetical protein
VRWRLSRVGNGHLGETTNATKTILTIDLVIKAIKINLRFRQMNVPSRRLRISET